MNSRILRFLVVACVILAPVALQADTIAGSLTRPIYSYPGDYVLGWAFAPNVNISVTGLGYYASAGTFASSHSVGLWDSSGNLLASTAVDNTDPIQGTWFRFRAISPVALLAGSTYVVGGTNLSDSFTFDSPTDPVTISYDPNLTYISSRWALGSALIYPGSLDSGAARGFFGANFVFVSETVVPEPGTLLLLAAGLGILPLLRRRG